MTDLTRRGLLGAVVAGLAGTTALSPVRSYLDRFAPASGTAWETAVEAGPTTVASPYGPATIGYDAFGVPTVSAEGDLALYYAVGYAQARDRLAQMDLQRRLVAGRLAEIVGEAALDSDRFHVRMGFRRAAEATWDGVRGSESGDALVAFADGVNAYIERGPLPMEFGLLEYRPEPWTPVDSILVEKLISWELTGQFPELRAARVADALGEEAARTLFPATMDHDAPVIRSTESAASRRERDRARSVRPVSAPAEWLAGFESNPRFGSNNWVVAGRHTASGHPLVAADSHISLMAPPVWYEMRHRAPDLTVHGALLPGSPFVVTGRNRHGAWGVTNSTADVLDVYTYETRDGRYRYGDEWREYETSVETIPVAGGDAESVTVRTTVHGPVIERGGQEVAVAWVGLTATRTLEAFHRLNRSTGLETFVDGLRLLDVPSLNFVYADTAGRTLYYANGKVPIRTTDGEPVAGDRVFDGSAMEGSWEGFTPYGPSTWEGFVPFEELPHLLDPAYVASANQRVADDYPHHFSHSYSDPYRAVRLYELLDAAVASGTPLTVADMESIQLDTADGRAAQLIPILSAASESASEELRPLVAALEGWDGRMTRDSYPAVLFEYWFERFRRETFAPVFEAAGLDSPIYPRDWVFCTLPADSVFFTERPDGRDRAAVALRALELARDDVEERGYESYGDYATTGVVDHQFGLAFLDYPAVASDGGRQTVRYFEVGSPAGSGWRQIYEVGGDDETRAVLPGGNSGDYYSSHYEDQVRRWADGAYRTTPYDADPAPAIRFVEAAR